jgi:hypothetical protein
MEVIINSTMKCEFFLLILLVLLFDCFEYPNFFFMTRTDVKRVILLSF